MSLGCRKWCHFLLDCPYYELFIGIEKIVTGKMKDMREKIYICIKIKQVDLLRFEKIGKIE